jgi:hypothetical protein
MRSTCYLCNFLKACCFLYLPPWRSWGLSPPRGPFLTSSLGVKLPPGVKFSVLPFILLNSRECSPLGWTKGWKFPLGDKFHPLGDRSEVRNGPLVCATIYIGFSTRALAAWPSLCPATEETRAMGREIDRQCVCRTVVLKKRFANCEVRSVKPA